MTGRITTDADIAMLKCLKEQRSFAMTAGAGSGKTTSLITALDDIRLNYGSTLRQNGQQIACITYTKRAVGVIAARLGFDDLYCISTLHSFLWQQTRRFTEDIRAALVDGRLPALIAKAKEKDTGKATKSAQKAREKAAALEADLESLENVESFDYDDVPYSDYGNGKLSHDDIIEIAGYLFANKPTFRKLVGFRFPFIFVDEAQDTFKVIVKGLNQTCSNNGLPIVGYFGDPWQQIYEDRAGSFDCPENGLEITKTENFRCSKSVIRLLNAFRDDVEQYAAGDNQDVEGSVEMMLIQAADPEAPRRRYSGQQLEQALTKMDKALEHWGWADREDVIRLFLARQMIARRLGFSKLNQLFTGSFSSQRSQENYENGEHFLLKPFLTTICPLVAANLHQDNRTAIDVLRHQSPAFDIQGENSKRSLSEMIELSKTVLEGLGKIWGCETVKDVLLYGRNQNLIEISERLEEALNRPPRTEEYNDAEHSIDKGDWLADQFFQMQTEELQAYCDFIGKNTAYSTQHGVKGEEYQNVLVVYDDTEAAWNQYNFTKLLTPDTAGEPTDGQKERGRKLAYVSFSRAEENLRIILFTLNPAASKKELIDRHLLTEEQIFILQ